MVAANTVAPRQNVLEFGVGLPDVISVGWRHGVASGFELGLRGSFTLGLQGLVLLGQAGTTSAWARGAKVQGLLKARLLEAGRVSLGLTFEPGVFLATWTIVYPGAPVVVGAGFLLPVELKLGVGLGERTTLGLTAGVPFWVELQALNQVMFPILVGVGIEHSLNHSVLLFARVRGGPAVSLGGGASAVLDAQLGLAWRLGG